MAAQRNIELRLDCQKLSYHKRRYQQSKLKHMRIMKNYNEIDKIKDFLTQNKIKAISLNHTVEPPNWYQKDVFL